MKKVMFVLLMLFAMIAYSGEGGAWEARTTEYDTVPGRDIRWLIYVDDELIFTATQMNGVTRPRIGDVISGVPGLVSGPWLVQGVVANFDMVRPDGLTLSVIVVPLSDFMAVR